MDLGNSLGYKPLRNGSRNRYVYYYYAHIIKSKSMSQSLP